MKSDFTTRRVSELVVYCTDKYYIHMIHRTTPSQDTSANFLIYSAKSLKCSLSTVLT